jgi:hypothetical protein
VHPPYIFLSAYLRIADLKDQRIGLCAIEFKEK